MGPWQEPKNWNSANVASLRVQVFWRQHEKLCNRHIGNTGVSRVRRTQTPDFVQKAAMSDMYEVQAGKLAAEKGQSDVVKQFGQQMVDAHTKTTEELTGIVKSKNIKVDLPTKLDAKHQKLIDDLNSASPQDFDKTYAKQQVDGHQEAVHLFKKYAAKGDDADVKQFAEKTLPTIEHHLDEAKKLPSGPPSA
jgi:putative membrane protein